MNKKTCVVWMAAVMVSDGSLTAQETGHAGQTNAVPPGFYQDSPLKPAPAAGEIWTAGGVGHGFRADAQEAGVSAGAGEETRDIGGRQPHHLLLTRLYYGHMLGNEVGADDWYGGNFELMQEVFGAWQYYRGSRYLTGTTTILRYNFATGTRWVPWLDAGAGVSLTNIGHPDLGSPGEFNLQIGTGVSYFWRDNVALTLQYRYMHISDAGIRTPNQGVNENICYAGISWFF